MTVRIHNCIAWQNCERRNFPSSLSLSLFHPPLSLFSLPPFYFATHSTLARICAPFYRYFKSSWNSINLSTLLIREEACARMHRFVKVARSFLSIPSIPAKLLRYGVFSSFFFLLSFFFRIVWFFLLIFNSLGLWKVVCWPRWWKFQQGAGRWKFRWGAIEVDGNDTDKGSIRPPSRVKGRSVIMYTSQTSG